MENVKLFDSTTALAELREFFGDVTEEETKEPAIVVALRRLIESFREDETFDDDPRGALIVEVLEMLLKPVTTENLVNIVNIVTKERAFVELLKENQETEE